MNVSRHIKASGKFWFEKLFEELFDSQVPVPVSFVTSTVVRHRIRS